MGPQDRILDGKYRLGRALVQSDRAFTVEATHLQLRESVAIKILHKNSVEPRLVARFLREARHAARVRSEHVVRYLDLGSLADGRPYLVMEKLSGEHLSKRIEGGPLPETTAVDCILQTCEALACAHARGIVHRDLRTSNLFCVNSPDRPISIKVLNFGTARAVEHSGQKEDEGLTVAALCLDAPEYKAPEQISMLRDLDARVDIWAVGVILCEIVTGKHPFAGASAQETVRRVLNAELPPLMELSPQLREVVLKCLKVRCDERFANVADLADALAKLGSSATAQYPERIRLALTAPAPPDGPADLTSGEVDENAPTVVREVIDLLGKTGGALPTAEPSINMNGHGLPRLDDGRTGARSWPWQRLWAPRSPSLLKESSTALRWRLALAGLSLVALLGILGLLVMKRVVVDVRIGETSGSASSSPAVSPTVSPAPTVAAVAVTTSTSPPEIESAAPAPTPTPEPRPAPVPTQAPPTRPARGRTPSVAGPPATGANGKDPWGWER